MSLDLDFTLSSSKERKNFIDKYMIGKSFTKKELETIADYLLYGKDENGLNSVDRKEIEINTRYGSYKKKKPESLDNLIDNPNFNENKIQNTNIYKVEKPTINREEDKDIPGIQELWKTIDYLQHLVDASSGRVIDPSIKPLDNFQLYKIKHYLIELRKEQFVLKDMVKPTCFFIKNPRTVPDADNGPQDIIWESENFAIKPLGLYSSNKKRFNQVREIQEYDYQANPTAKYTIDFTNSQHIYALIEFYEDFIIAAEDNPESLMDDIMETLDWYINFAALDEIQTEILELKKKKISVKEIQEILQKKFKVNYSTNYISTIFTKKICMSIAAAAELHQRMYLNRDNNTMWKKCNQCGEIKFLDTINFMRKTKSSDGYNSKCKKCCKENRIKEKNKIQRKKTTSSL